MENINIRCPECDSDYIVHNAFTNLIPLEDYYMYTCRDCNEQFNLDVLIDQYKEKLINGP